MSLRTRLTLVVAVLIALIVVLMSVFMLRTARNELRGGVDSFLEQRAMQVELAIRIETLEKGVPRGFDFEEFLTRPDTVTQFLDRKGTIIFSWPLELPIDETDRSLSTGRDLRKNISGQRFRDVEVEEAHYRMLSKELGNVGLLQIGRDLSEVNSALEGMKQRTLIFGGGGILIAALVAWIVSSRFTRPVLRLTKAAEHVSQTQDLTAFIEAGGGGSEIDRLAESFNIMLQALATSREQQRRLIEDASHELRTPLTSLRTNIEVLLRSPELEATELSTIVNDLKQETEELGFLVTELVELATAVSQEKEAFMEGDLGEIVELVAQRFERRSGRGITVLVRGESTRGIRLSRIDRAVSNLVENAIKFSPDETPIDILVDGGRVSVRDHGAGVNETDKKRMFDRFFRAATARSMPGSGLGLSIVDEIIRAHGGKVFVESPEAGQGTIVGFEI
jgi:two-component system sensor histidine kinase MprB